ncbi:sigma-54 factor interaction domain-containing protein [Candidatus Poribacteria bacterium]|nr:sigma-54 factor interaction domain-containing protein [Candidatus Poribacteria bacterium]
MFHRTKVDKPYDERGISISEDQSNERLTHSNLKPPLEKKGDRIAILAENTLQGNYESILGRSPQILEVLKQIDKVANTIARVLIWGETGTGKELIARALHQNSDRSGNKMVSVNCAAMQSLVCRAGTGTLLSHWRYPLTSPLLLLLAKLEKNPILFPFFFFIDRNLLFCYILDNGFVRNRPICENLSLQDENEFATDDLTCGRSINKGVTK